MCQSAAPIHLKHAPSLESEISTNLDSPTALAAPHQREYVPNSLSESSNAGYVQQDRESVTIDVQQPINEGT